ncbi:hypothetical protein Tco_0891900 [Tanacetum coccineum]|uniref:Uncharacterized protein n=1 Tax=Tanacetum coccineum TaxID=301880 RepID=A0ABQ5C7H7_9ASTR
MKETPYELLKDNEKKQLGKNEEAKMIVRISQKSQENNQKNEQARTRESEEFKKKPKNQSRSQKSQASAKSWSTKVNKPKS